MNTKFFDSQWQSVLCQHETKIKNYSPSELCSVLSEFEIVDELERELFQFENYPKQNFSVDAFGQPSFTIWRREGISLDVYFWFESNLEIHSHNFEGAFKILRGKSFNVEYNFASQDEYSWGRVGNLEHMPFYQLKKGDCREISGQNFIHAVIHCEKPTITLCFRKDPADEPLNFYLYPNYEITLDKRLELILQKKMLLEKNSSYSVFDYDRLSESELGYMIGKSYYGTFNSEMIHNIAKKYPWYEKLKLGRANHELHRLKLQKLVSSL